jgi:lysophospholipase L1-like esterase
MIDMRLRPAWRRAPRLYQSSFEFITRAHRHERLFKWSIVVATLAVIALILTRVPWGRYLASSITSLARETTRKVLRLQSKRSQIDESWRVFRQTGIDVTRPRVERLYTESTPAMQRLLRYAGMDPEHALLRWGNFNWTLLLSSKVFEADEEGRSYRLRPRTRSIWLNDPLQFARVPMFYLVPDEQGLREAVRGTMAVVVEASRQTTNSWGVRGPEPDLDAALRVIVLGDSFMQGLLIGDDETPPECLRRELERQLCTRVSVLNTGLMGYSPEQYYYSLLAFADRFRPHLVVISISANDFGNAEDAAGTGKGDWREGRYWLDKIVRYCRARHWPHLVVAAPFRPRFLDDRREGYYPGSLSNIFPDESPMFLNPIEEFIDAHLKLVSAAKRAGKPALGSPLFNEVWRDDHFSALGSEVWAAAVGRRLALIWNRERASNPQVAGGGS